jgi:hypothetical protein
MGISYTAKKGAAISFLAVAPSPVIEFIHELISRQDRHSSSLLITGTGEGCHSNAHHCRRTIQALHAGPAAHHADSFPSVQPWTSCTAPGFVKIVKKILPKPKL